MTGELPCYCDLNWKFKNDQFILINNNGQYIAIKYYFEEGNVWIACAGNETEKSFKSSKEADYWVNSILENFNGNLKSSDLI